MNTATRKDFRGTQWAHAYGDMWWRKDGFVARTKPLSYDIPTDPKDPKSPRIFVQGVNTYTLRHERDISWK